jgi:hypothetical protein
MLKKVICSWLNMRRINPVECGLGRLVASLVALEIKADKYRTEAKRPEEDLKVIATDSRYNGNFRAGALAIAEDLESIYQELDRREKQYGTAKNSR